MKISLPKQITWLFDIFAKHDKEIFLVGGCVRDMLMKREVHDYDMTTQATPDEMMEILKQEDCMILPTGIQHGTLTIIKDHLPIEITTYRFEQTYVAHRTPEQVTFTSSLQEDLARRDFTMNAIAWHPQHGLIDPYDGQNDIQNHLIRCVGNAMERFDEDALRILRALRFFFVLNFSLDEACYEAIQTQAHLLSFISMERIREEFDRMLLSDHKDILLTLRKLHVLPYIIQEYPLIYDVPQECKWHCFDVFHHTNAALNHTRHDLHEKLAIVFHDIGKAESKTYDEKGHAHFHGHPAISEQLARTVLKRLTYSNQTIDTVCTLIRYHDYYVTPSKRVLRRFLAHVDMNYALAYAILHVQYADDCAKNMELAQAKIENLEACIQLLQVMEQENDRLTLKDLAVNGHDMIALGFVKQEIREVLQYLYHDVLDHPEDNEREKLINLAKQFQCK